MTKKLLMFLCALLLTSVSALAEDYPFKVMGVQVTSSNASSIYEIDGKTAFWAEKKSGAYWLHIKQPNTVDEIVYKGETLLDNIINLQTADDVYICIENDVHLRGSFGPTDIGIELNVDILLGKSPKPQVGSLHITSSSGWSNLDIGHINLMGINEFHVSDVQLYSSGELFGEGSIDLFVEGNGFIQTSSSISSFKSINKQSDAITNAASIKDTGDGFAISLRDANDDLLKGAYVGIMKYPFKVMGVQVTSSNVSSIYKIGGETVFSAEKKDDGSYWLYVRQPDGVDVISYDGEEGREDDLITFTDDIDEVYICAENDVVLTDNKCQCIGVEQPLFFSNSYRYPTVNKLYFTSLSGYSSLAVWTKNYNLLSPPIDLYKISEIHVSDVQLSTYGLICYRSPKTTELFVENFGYISAKSIYRFKSITIQDKAITNADSFKDTGDDYGVAAREEDGDVMGGNVYVGIRKFPLTVAGIEVTDLNADNVTGAGISALDPEKDYKLSYDADLNRLTLSNVQVVSDGEFVSGICYMDKQGTLKVVFMDCSSIVSKHYGIESKGGINIAGGSVEGYYGVLADGDVTIEGACHIKGSSSAIWGNPLSKLDLYSVVALKAEGDGVVIGGFGNYEEPWFADDCVSNATFYDTEDGYGVAARDGDGSAIMGEAVIVTCKVGVKVAGREVTAADEYFSDGTITGDGITGKVTYKDDALWLEDATIETLMDDNPIGIEIQSGGPTNIYMVGKNTIKAKEAGILDRNGIALQGDVADDEELPQLTILSEKDGISIQYEYNDDVYVKSLHLEVDAKRVGINGNNGTPSINPDAVSYLRLRGQEFGAASWVGGLGLSQGKIEITTPGVTFEKYDENGMCLLKGGELMTDWVEIRHVENYFKIGDLIVNEFNVDAQPYSDPSIEGTVTFDKETGMLTLEDATITPMGKYGIDLCSVGNYQGKVSQIVLKGVNAISTSISGSYTIYNNSSLMLMGGGTLKSNSIIENKSEGNLMMVNCHLQNLENDSYISITNYGSMDMNNCSIENLVSLYNGSSSNISINNSVLRMTDDNLKLRNNCILNHGTLNIGGNSYVEAWGKYFGYVGKEGSSLTIDNATLKLKADEYNEEGYGSALGYNLSLWGDVELDKTNGETLYKNLDNYFEVRRDGKVATDWVTFTVPADKKKYEIYVGGEQVTGLNLDGITGENITGTVTYDPMARRLTLTNATIGDGGVSLGYGMGSQELMLCGNNTITGEDPMGSSLTVNDGLTITSPDGTGKLTIDNKMFGAFTGGTWTVVRNCELDFKSVGTGMTGMGTLTIEGSKVRVQGATGSLMAFSSVTLGEDMFYDKPDGCVYNTETSQLEVGGELYTGEVVFRYVKNYGIQIGDFAVNSDNYDAIKPAILKSGTITFNPETSLLTLSGVRLENGGITANSSIEELTIVVDGECSITKAAEPLKLLCPAFIVSKNSVEKGKPGQGILNDKLSIATEQTGVYFDGMLYVNDITMTVTAGKKALAGNGPGSLIYIDTSNIEAIGTSDGAITSIGMLDLYDRMRFVNPDQSFDEETGCVTEGGSAAKTVTIRWYMPGDANDDYQVDVSDVKAIADNIWEV